MKLKLHIIGLVFAYVDRFAQGGGTRYTITLDSNWSQATHPHPSGSLPANTHWSRLVGAVHNNQIHFFTLGEPASRNREYC